MTRGHGCTKIRTFATDGLTTSTIGYGDGLVDGVYGHSDDHESLRPLEHAIDAVSSSSIPPTHPAPTANNVHLVGRVIAGRPSELQDAFR